MFRMPSVCCAVIMGLLAVPTLATFASATEQAKTSKFDDPSLRWAACPSFMPEGCRIAVLNGDPNEPHADIFYQVPGGTQIASHWHTSPERMVLVTGQLQVTYEGQEPVLLEQGTYAYGPAKKPHSAHCLSSNPCTLFIAFVDPIDALEAPSQ